MKPSQTPILVLDADTGAALSILQSLGRAGYATSIAGSSASEKAFASKYARHKIVLPDPLTDKKAFQQQLLEVQAQHRFALIIPPSERTLAPMHELRAELGDAGRALPPARGWETCVDKEAMRLVAVELGVPTPSNFIVRGSEDLESTLLDDWIAAGPVVCKSILSKAWNGDVGVAHPVQVVYDRERLTHVVEQMLVDTSVQIQRWIPGHGVGVELLADHGEVLLSFAHERVHELPLTGGGSSYRRSIEMPLAMLEDSRRIMKALDWTGVAMVEFRRHGDDYWMIELNGRFWGSLPLAQFAGIDFPLALVRLLLDGERPTQPEWRPVYARQLHRDLGWFKAVAKLHLADLKHRGPRTPQRKVLLDRPLLTSVAELARVVTGRETWDGASLADPMPLVHEVRELARTETRNLYRRAEQWLAHRNARASWKSGASGVRRVLVLCSGNICRSPYAVRALVNAGLEARGAALVGPSGRETPIHVQRVATARGIDLSDHRSVALSEEDIAWADLVLIMDMTHARAVEKWPSARDKVRWLGALVDDGPSIADPIDFAEHETDLVLDQIDRAVKRLVELAST